MTHERRESMGSAIVRRLGSRMVVVSFLALGLATPAHALPLCEGVSGQVCREEVVASVSALITSLELDVKAEGDRRAAVKELEQAVREFALAGSEVEHPRTGLTEEQICTRAGKQDDRGLEQIAKGVKAAVKIASSRFTSQAAFAHTRAAIADLASTAIGAVTDNVGEVELAVGDMPEVADAHERLAKAESNLDAGKLDKAADEAQRAYDVVRDEANVAGCLDNQA